MTISPESRPTPSQFDNDDVRDALESFRRAVDLGDNPLRNLVLVWQRVETAELTASLDAIDLAVRDVLYELIRENLSRLRQLDGRDEPDDSRKEQLIALVDDWQSGNAELEAWSSLYYRYVRLDLNLQVQDVARNVHSVPRQVRRRLARGVRRLAQELGTQESAARLENRRLGRWLKLPAMGQGKLFGIEQLIVDLAARLTSRQSPSLLVVSGAGGLGKTTVAHAALRRVVREDAFDDIAWVGLEESVTYPVLLTYIVRELGYPHLIEQPTDDLERALRALLRATRTALVIDNADLLKGYPAILDRLSALVGAGKVLLTVRQWPGSETAAHIITLDPLSREAVRGLIRHEASERHIPQAEDLAPDSLDSLYEAIGGNPLAARLVVGQLAHLPLERVLDNLAGLHTDEGVSLFDALFERTWETLSEDACHVALALLLIPTEGAFWQELMLVANLSKDSLDAAITELTGSALLEAMGPAPRYAIHPLTRRYLEQLIERDEYREVFEGILQRSARRAGELIESADTEGMSQYSLRTWLQLLGWQAELGVEPEVTSMLLMRVAPIARRSGQWQRWASVLQQVAARLAEDDLARVRLETGVALRWLGEIDDAAQALEEAISRFGESGAFKDQAEALIELGALYAGSGRTGEADLAYRRAVSAAERYGAKEDLRRALNGLATLALQRDDVEEALYLLRRALNLSSDEPHGQTLSNLGVACLGAGLLDEALAFQRDALGYYEVADDLPHQARAHVRLASVYAAREEYELARRHFEDGLTLMRALGDALGQARTLVNLGAAHKQEGRWEDAFLIWKDALALQRHLGDEVGMVYTLYNLADVQWAAGDERAARESLQQAALLAEKIDVPALAEKISRHPAMNI